MEIQIAHVLLVVTAEKRQFIGPAVVLKNCLRERLSDLGDTVLDRCDQTGDTDSLLLPESLAFCNRGLKGGQFAVGEIVDFE